MSKLKEILNREPIFINPYTDFGFKKLFGEEGNKDLLIDFLNQLLPERHQIEDLTFKNGEKQPHRKNKRRAIFDIYCTSKSGEAFIIEMQKAKVANFIKRSIFYLTFPIIEQSKKGKEWDFELKPIYLIAILDFEYDEQNLKRETLRTVALIDQNGELFSDSLHLKYLQMPFFNKKETELETKLDKWLFFLKNLENFDHIPSILNEPIFKKGFETAKIVNMNAREYAAYEKNRLIYWENKSALKTSRKEGQVEQIRKTIKNGLLMGLSVENIAKIAEIEVEYVLKIKAQLIGEGLLTE